MGPLKDKLYYDEIMKMFEIISLQISAIFWKCFKLGWPLNLESIAIFWFFVKVTRMEYLASLIRFLPRSEQRVVSINFLQYIQPIPKIYYVNKH